MFQLVCMTCGRNCEDLALASCPQDGGVLDVQYDSAEIPLDPKQPGIWKFRARLPIADAQHIVSLGEGDTPLVRSQSLGESIGLPALYFKNDGLNPTGSYKDRLASVGISYLRQLGIEAWSATSSGNGGASLSAYGARAGVDGYLFTLERAPRAKVAQIIAYGPTIMSVRGMGLDPEAEAATWDNIARLCRKNNWLNLITARSISPQSMEGAKTIAYEVCQQAGGEPPDIMYVPTGGGGLLSAVLKGFVEWQEAGYIDRLPRMVCVQPLGCDPITQAWQAGRKVEPLDDCTGTISGISLTTPPDGELVLEALRQSNGWAISLSDEATYQAQEELANREGLFAEPAAAVTWAAVKADRGSGRLKGEEKVICLLTGIGFKDSAAIQRMTEHVDLPLIEAGEILTVGQSDPG